VKLPALPHLPGASDLLRRIRVPDDLDSVTTAGPEDDAGPLGADAVERIWRGARGLYRSGAHPGLQVCVRHRGAVVLNRAIGHARGNGPHEPAGAETVSATPDTPMLIYSGAKAVTATLMHRLHEREALDINDPSPPTSPAMTAAARARSRSPMSSPIGPASPTWSPSCCAGAGSSTASE
jgi:CubicO group peptidase (beta-lactamase class C family)